MIGSAEKQGPFDGATHWAHHQPGRNEGSCKKWLLRQGSTADLQKMGVFFQILFMIFEIVKGKVVKRVMFPLFKPGKDG